LLIKTSKSSQTAPVLALLWAATFWGSMWYPLRLLEAAGLNGLWTTWVIFAAAAVPGLLLAWPARRELLDQPGLLLLIAFANGWLNTAFVLAMLEGNVVRVLLLFYLSPLWSTLLAWWWLGERPHATGIATLALAMVGAVIMLWDPATGWPWPQSQADWLAISSGLGFSVSNVLVRRLHHLSLPLKSAVIWWGVVLVAGGWLLAVGDPLPVISLSAWLGALALGLVGIFTVVLAIVYGVARMPVHRSAVILLFELVSGTISSQLLTEEVVSLWEWLGGGLIVLAAYVSARSEA
jgi:drug/metabolite transporter (DMT)-like permease